MKFQNPSMHCTKDMACIRFHKDLIQRDITSDRNSGKKKKKKKKRTCVKYPYMKFQNPDMHGS